MPEIPARDSDNDLLTLRLANVETDVAALKKSVHDMEIKAAEDRGGEETAKWFKQLASPALTAVFVLLAKMIYDAFMALAQKG